MNRSRVRFPQAAPIERHSGYKDFRVCREVFGVAFSLFWGGFEVARSGVLGCRAAPSRGGSELWSRLSEGVLYGCSRKRQKVQPRVKKFSPASKSMGLSSKSTEPELTDISKVATGLRCPGEPGGSYLYCWNSSVRLARFRVERLLWVKSKWV